MVRSLSPRCCASRCTEASRNDCWAGVRADSRCAADSGFGSCRSLSVPDAGCGAGVGRSVEGADGVDSVEEEGDVNPASL
jgi:hypothetical protein